MRFASKSGLTLALSLIIVAVALGNPSFDMGYPKPGPNAGEIECKDTIILAPGGIAKTSGTGKIIVYPKGGGILPKEFPITIEAGKQETVSWKAKITDLGPFGAEYNLIPIVDVKIDKKDREFWGPPKVGAAAK
jgi:hypothetical protein